MHFFFWKWEVFHFNLLLRGSWWLDILEYLVYTTTFVKNLTRRKGSKHKFKWSTINLIARVSLFLSRGRRERTLKTRLSHCYLSLMTYERTVRTLHGSREPWWRHSCFASSWTLQRRVQHHPHHWPVSTVLKLKWVQHSHKSWCVTVWEPYRLLKAKKIYVRHMLLVLIFSCLSYLVPSWCIIATYAFFHLTRLIFCSLFRGNFARRIMTQNADIETPLYQKFHK